MKSTTAQRFGSLGKSFGAPSTAAAVIGAALLASDTSDTSETAWSPAAACLLPDVLPVAGTLLSYGGSRQLAAGGTVTHSGALHLTGDSSGTAGKVYLGSVTPSTRNYAIGGYGGHTWINAQSDSHYVHIGTNDNWGFAVTGSSYSAMPNQVGMTNGFKLGWGDNPVSTLDAYFVRNSASSIGLKGSGGIDAALTCGAITASGNVVVGGGATLNWTGSTLSLASQSFNALGVNLWNGSRLGFCAGYGVSDVSIARVSSTGLAAYTTSAGTTPADWTCGAITASGAVSGTGLVASDNAAVSAASGAAGEVRIFGGSGLSWFGRWNQSAIDIGSSTCIQWHSTGILGTADFRLARNAAGQLDARGDGGLRVRNFANSADAALTCGAITASGAIQETPTQSALNPTTTNIPSGKRQGWYNSTLSEFRDWVNIGGTLLKSAAYT